MSCCLVCAALGSLVARDSTRTVAYINPRRADTATNTWERPYANLEQQRFTGARAAGREGAYNFTRDA